MSDFSVIGFSQSRPCQNLARFKMAANDVSQQKYQSREEAGGSTGTTKRNKFKESLP